MLHLSQNDAGSLNITKLLSSYGATQEQATLKSSAHVRRIIRSLEEIEDEESSGANLIKSDTESADDDNENVLFSGNYFERNSESMKFKMEEPSGGEDWDGGLIGESGAEQDDDVADDIIQTQTHGVTAMKRTEMASVVNPSDIEEFESDTHDGNVENLEEGEGTFVESSSSGSSGSNGLVEIHDQHLSGSEKVINKTIMREVQRNLHKVWRYASSGKNLEMISKGPKGKEEERKLQEIYNLVIKHESGGAGPKASVSGEASGLNLGYGDVSGESGNDEDERFEMGSAIFRESEDNDRVTDSGNDDISGESSGLGDFSEISGDSASGPGVVNKKLLKEVEHNLHKVWRYAAPKKDLDMVAKGPKGEEEEQKVKKIYNLISKHESGSAFIDYETKKKEKSLNDSKQTRKHRGKHKSRKSRLTETSHNITEAKLYRLQKARKYKYDKNLKSIKAWGMGMGKLTRKPNGMYLKRIGKKGNAGRNRDNALAILGEEMKELAPSNDNDGKTNFKEKSRESKQSKSKSDHEETATESSVNETASQEAGSDHETSSAPEKSQSQNIVLDRQKPFDKTQLEIGKKLEELILSRMAQLQSQGLETKRKGKQEHLKDSKEKDDKTEMEKELQKGKS